MTRDLFDDEPSDHSSDSSLDDGLSSALRQELATTYVPYDGSVVDRMVQAATAGELQHVRTWHAPLAAAAAVVLVGGGAAAIAAHSGPHGESSGGGAVCPSGPSYSGTVVPSFSDTAGPSFTGTATYSVDATTAPPGTPSAPASTSSAVGGLMTTASPPPSRTPISTIPNPTVPSPTVPSASAPISAIPSNPAPCAPPTAAPDATTSAPVPTPQLSSLPNGAVATARTVPSSGRSRQSTRTPITIDVTAQPGHRAVVDGPAIPRLDSLTVTDVQLIRRSGTDGDIELERGTSGVLGDTLSNLSSNVSGTTTTPDDPFVFTSALPARAVLTCAGTTTCTVRLVLHGTYLG